MNNKIMLLEKSLDQYVYLIPQHDGVEEERKTLKNQSLDSKKYNISTS